MTLPFLRRFPALAISPQHLRSVAGWKSDRPTHRRSPLAGRAGTVTASRFQMKMEVGVGAEIDDVLDRPDWHSAPLPPDLALRPTTTVTLPFGASMHSWLDLHAGSELAVPCRLRCMTCASRKLVSPMKSATKRDRLLVDHRCRRADLQDLARDITAMRSDMVSASSWSWVTKMKVMPVSCCSRFNSICISLRSL